MHLTIHEISSKLKIISYAIVHSFQLQIFSVDNYDVTVHSFQLQIFSVDNYDVT